jgi:hypothetical protein
MDPKRCKKQEKHHLYSEINSWLFRIPSDGQCPQTKWFWVLYTIVKSIQILLVSVLLAKSADSPRACCGDTDGLTEHAITMSVLAQHHELVQASRAQVWDRLIIRAVVQNLRGPPLDSVRGSVPAIGQPLWGFCIHWFHCSLHSHKETAKHSWNSCNCGLASIQGSPRGLVH